MKPSEWIRYNAIDGNIDYLTSIIEFLNKHADVFQTKKCTNDTLSGTKKCIDNECQHEPDKNQTLKKHDGPNGTCVITARCVDCNKPIKPSGWELDE